MLPPKDKTHPLLTSNQYLSLLVTRLVVDGSYDA